MNRLLRYSDYSYRKELDSLVLRRDLIDDVLKEPSQEIIFDDFGDNALIFETFFWCRIGREKTLRMVRSDIRFAIDKVFAEQGIVLAFPQRDIHLHTPKPIEVTLNKEL